MRLNKFIAATGTASRRKADRLIQEGRVTVNGKAAALGMAITPGSDHVKVDGKLIRLDEDKVYLVLFKPRGYLCSTADKAERPLVTDLLKEYRGKRLFTIGRLDFNSEGLIILTNDGEFASKVGHPSSGPTKTYQVRVRGVPDETNLERLRSGIRVKNYKTRPAEVQLRKTQKNAWLEVTLKEGRNRQVRNMFEAVGHPVVKLRRTRIGPVTTAGLKPGDYRLLTSREIDRLSRP